MYLPDGPIARQSFHLGVILPAANASRFNGVVATDTYFSDTPAMKVGQGGTTVVQLFCGCQSLITAVYPMWREGDISGTFEDFIRQYGAPNSFFSDNARAQIGKTIRIFNVSPTISIRILRNAEYKRLTSLVILF
jgi:hypothetical protein